MKRVILLFQRQLLSTTVNGLLQNREDLELIEIPADMVDWVAMVDSVKPDVIITDEQMMVEHRSAYTRFLRRYPLIRTIVLQIDSNKMQICDKRSIEVRQVNDFVELI